MTQQAFMCGWAIFVFGILAVTYALILRESKMPKIIEGMALEGWGVEMGPHLGLSGYYANFFKTGNDYKPSDCRWDEAGHGETLTEAIVMARDIVLGEMVVVPRPEEFA